MWINIEWFLFLRYNKPTEVEILEERAVLDPRFKMLIWMSEVEKEIVYDRVADKAIDIIDQPSNSLDQPIVLNSVDAVSPNSTWQDNSDPAPDWLLIVPVHPFLLNGK